MKSSYLLEIEDEIRKCRECMKGKSGLPVPGEGDPDAMIMFVGEAPGREESKTGRPFVGRAGKLLTRLLKSAGIERENVFITSPVKFYPGKRTPTRKEILHGREHLVKQIDVIKPKLIVALGNVALKALFPERKLAITQIHGKFFEENGVTYFPTFHPAAGLRFQKYKKLLEKDFKKIKKEKMKACLITFLRNFRLRFPCLLPLGRLHPLIFQASRL